MNRTGRSVVHTRSPAETRRFGAAVAARMRGGACVALVGPLGSGKTEWVRGACVGFGVDEDVLSPTFILYEEFAGRLRVAHVDLYRLEHESEVEDLGVFDLLGTDTVVLVEWADRSETLMEHSEIVVAISDTGPTARRFTVTYAQAFAGVFEGVESWL